MFFQQSPKMLKIVSENFIHALLLFLGLFRKISRWVPLRINFRFRGDLLQINIEQTLFWGVDLFYE